MLTQYVIGSAVAAAIKDVVTQMLTIIGCGCIADAFWIAICNINDSVGSFSIVCCCCC